MEMTDTNEATNVAIGMAHMMGLKNKSVSQLKREIELDDAADVDWQLVREATLDLYCHACGGHNVSIEEGPDRGWARCLTCGLVDRIRNYPTRAKAKKH